VHASSVESFFERRSAEHLTFDHRKLDRLGRRVKGLLDLANEMKGQHIHFKSLTDSIDTKTPVGRLFFHVMASLAQMEQELIAERTRAVAVSRDRTLRVWDLQSAKEIITFTGEGRIFSEPSLRTGERILSEASQADCISWLARGHQISCAG
jgi:hypothetical protein